MKAVGNLLNRAEPFSWLREAERERNSTSVWAGGALVPGGKAECLSREAAKGCMEMAHSKAGTCCWGYKALVAEPRLFPGHSC